MSSFGDDFGDDLDRARMERKLDVILDIVTEIQRRPVAPLPCTHPNPLNGRCPDCGATDIYNAGPYPPSDCHCPSYGYVCNNVSCPRALRVTS